MGLSSWLARLAVTGAHVLVVESPGAWLTRVAVEQRLVRRGWRQAISPADADVLVVCGHPGGRLADAVEVVWEQMPGPRARVAVVDPDPSTVDAALDQACGDLRDRARQRDDATRRPTAPPDATHEQHGEMHQAGMDQAYMDHEHMDMSGPGGIPLAGGARGRDGLDMDVLHLPLGPILPYWPAGLVVSATMQGDVVADVEVDRLGSDHQPPEQLSLRLQAACHCDDAAALLMLAGWESAAADAFGARDALLAGAPPQLVAEMLDRLRARMARSRSLRWSLRGLGVLEDDLVARHQLPEETSGDVHARLMQLLTLTRDRLRTGGTVGIRSPAVTAVLPDLVGGLDLAAVRLVVASLAPFATHQRVTASGGHHG